LVAAAWHRLRFVQQPPDSVEGRLRKVQHTHRHLTLNNFNPMFLTTVNIPWNDANRNGITEGAGFGQGELGPNPNPLFGILQNRALDPNFNREYNLQYSAGIQQQVARGVTLNFNWNRRVDYQQVLTLNNAVPASAWTPYEIVNPLDGTPITVFNLQPAYFGL